MNHPSQFARLTHGADAKAADARPSLLPASAAINHSQMAVHSLGEGRSGFGSCVLPPACGQGRARVRLVGRGFSGVSVSLHDLPLKLGRRRMAGGLFLRLRGCSNTRLASIHNAADHLLHNRSDRFPRHRLLLLSTETTVEQELHHAVPETRVSGTPNDC